MVKFSDKIPGFSKTMELCFNFWMVFCITELVLSNYIKNQSIKNNFILTTQATLNKLATFSYRFIWVCLAHSWTPSNKGLSKYISQNGRLVYKSVALSTKGSLRVFKQAIIMILEKIFQYCFCLFVHLFSMICKRYTFTNFYVSETYSISCVIIYWGFLINPLLKAIILVKNQHFK